MVHLVGLGDCDPMVLAFNLVSVQLTGKGCDVCVERVAPRIKEVCLYGKLLLCCDYAPRLELLDHRLGGLILVNHVVLFKIFHILRVDGCKNGFDRYGIYHLMKCVLLPVELVVLLELEELAPLGVVLNFWVEELWIFDAPVVEVLIPGGETNFGLGEPERKETVLAPPFRCSEMAREGRDLVNKVSNGVEGGLSHSFVEQDCFHPSPYHFGDSGHCCCDLRHDCAVLTLIKIT